MKATFTKLRDGSWGIRVQGVVHTGDIVTVDRKSGVPVATGVGEIVWSGNGVTICKASKTAGSSSKQPKGRPAASPDVRIEYPSQGQTYSRDCHGVYSYDTFPRSSVLAGQQRRSFRFSGTLEECQDYCRKQYGSCPETVSGCGYVPAYVSHLPTGQDW